MSNEKRTKVALCGLVRVKNVPHLALEAHQLQCAIQVYGQALSFLISKCEREKEEREREINNVNTNKMGKSRYYIFWSFSFVIRTTILIIISSTISTYIHYLSHARRTVLDQKACPSLFRNWWTPEHLEILINVSSCVYKHTPQVSVVVAYSWYCVWVWWVSCLRIE